MNLNCKKTYWASLVTVGLLSSSSAQLLFQWTFDVDGTNAVGGIDMNFNANASVSNSCSKVGDGAVQISRANAPATFGGTVTQSPIDWSAFANGDTRTIAFWVRPDTAQDGAATWFSTGINNPGTRFDIRTNGGNFRVEVQGAGVDTTTPVNDGTWHHAAVVAPNASTTFGDLLFFVDGNEIPNPITGDAANLAINTATGVVRLGESIFVQANRDFGGLIDDVRIYESALTLADIQALVDAGRPIGCFEAASDTLILDNSIDLEWEADNDVTGLTITNDQDATAINALAIGPIGTTPVEPTTTTVYTIAASDADGLVDSRQFTINVQDTPDINSFTDGPELAFATGNITLNWTTASAGQLEITDDQDSTPIVFTTTADTQEFLDAGSVTIPNVTTTTTYTLTATLEEDGTGATATAQTIAMIQLAPDLTLVAAPSVSNAATNVTLFFNATTIESETEVTTGDIEGFGTSSGLQATQVRDNDVTDFATILAGPGPFVFEVTDGGIEGTQFAILGFNGNVLDLDGDPSTASATFQNYRIVEISLSGTDSLSISDNLGNTLFTTTDPSEIANGSFVVSNVSADTTFTASASIAGGDEAQDEATFSITGDGSSYEEVVLSRSPIGYYRFEESLRSSVIYDSSGNAAHSVTIDNSQFLTSGSPGILGNGGLFAEPEAAGAAVVTGLTFDPAATSWSITALAEAAQLFNGNAHLVSNRDGPSAGIGRSQLFLTGADATLTTFLSVGNVPNADSPINLDTPYLVNASCHVAVTYDLPTTTLRTYIDGALEAESVVTTDTADGAWVIGAQKTNQPMDSGMEFSMKSPSSTPRSRLPMSPPKTPPSSTILDQGF